MDPLGQNQGPLKNPKKKDPSWKRKTRKANSRGATFELPRIMGRHDYAAAGVAERHREEKVKTQCG